VSARLEKSIDWGISGSRERIFVSSAFGCHYHCTYCYLKRMKVEGVQAYFKKEELLEGLRRKGIFVPGRQGSLITIGCFTECLDEGNRKTTMDMIAYFLRQGNYVQISTKKRISREDMSFIAGNIQYDNQMNLYVSLPTLSFARELEPDVDSPEMRVENLKGKREYGIHTCLYIKPVLEGITIKDAKRYAQLVNTYQVPAVVGELLDPTGKDTGNKGREKYIGNVCMTEHQSNDCDQLTRYLGKYTRVYRNSDDMIKQMREGWNNNESVCITNGRS
jgi:DNA repair photolyase